MLSVLGFLPLLPAPRWDGVCVWGGSLGPQGSGKMGVGAQIHTGTLDTSGVWRGSVALTPCWDKRSFSPIHLSHLWSQRVHAQLHLYPNSGHLLAHSPTQYIHISSWSIVGNSETHRPHAEHASSAGSGTSFKLRCHPVAPAPVGPF